MHVRPARTPDRDPPENNQRTRRPPNAGKPTPHHTPRPAANATHPPTTSTDGDGRRSRPISSSEIATEALAWGDEGVTGARGGDRTSARRMASQFFPLLGRHRCRHRLPIIRDGLCEPYRHS